MHTVMSSSITKIIIQRGKVIKQQKIQNTKNFYINQKRRQEKRNNSKNRGKDRKPGENVRLKFKHIDKYIKCKS